MLVFNPIGYPQTDQFQLTGDTYKVLWLQVVVNYVMTVDDLKVMKLYNMIDLYSYYTNVNLRLPKMNLLFV